MPTTAATKKKEKERGANVAGNLFSFLFQIVGSGAYPPPPGQGGATWSLIRLPNMAPKSINPELGPQYRANSIPIGN
jgi:hypothetical protein